MTSLPTHTDVLIVGTGPGGAALATLLERYGATTLAIDKATDIFRAPRAIALDNEALRVLQLCGLEEDAIDTVAIPDVRLHSPVFGQYSRAVTAGSIDGHPRLVTFFQPQLETVLRERLARSRHVSVALGVELVSFTEVADCVRAELKLADGQAAQVHARYLVGADGANSSVRRMLGQEFRGKTYPEDWLIVDARHVATPIDHVEFNCDPRRPGPHMVAPGDRQRWEFKLHPGETREQMEQPGTVRRLLEPWTRGQEVDIERVAVYRFHARVASSFKVGRVFLVGDAAHITPPFVGQGLVAGLRDVANLAWKLAWVCQGRARPELLETYDEERRPHAKAIVDLARGMGRLVAPRSQVAAVLTHGLMSLLGRLPRLRRLFEDLEIKPANRFRSGCFVKPSARSRLARGGQLPQAWLRSRAGDHAILSDDAIGRGFAVVGFGVDPTSGLPDALVQSWQAAGGGFVQIDPRGRSAHASRVGRWEDVTGVLIPTVVPVGWVAIVRPDKTVMHDGPSGATAGMLTEALALFSEKPRGEEIVPAPAH
jgi:3-(3-hydroxy-phenyl)propionate hydroxylase